MSQTAYIFVDDGLPESMDYDDGYIGFDPGTSDSYRQALHEANRLRAFAEYDATPARRNGPARPASRRTSPMDRLRSALFHR